MLAGRAGAPARMRRSRERPHSWLPAPTHQPVSTPIGGYRTDRRVPWTHVHNFVTTHVLASLPLGAGGTSSPLRWVTADPARSRSALARTGTLSMDAHSSGGIGCGHHRWGFHRESEPPVRSWPTFFCHRHVDTIERSTILQLTHVLALLQGRAPVFLVRPVLLRSCWFAQAGRWQSAREVGFPLAMLGDNSF